MLWQPINLLLSIMTLGGAFLAAVQVSVFSDATPVTAMSAALDHDTVNTDSPDQSGPLEINRSTDGLFYVDGNVNGVSIRFAIDTGASVIVLNKADAKRIGWEGAPSSTHRIRTASGYGKMTWKKADQINVAGKSLGDLDIAVMDGGPAFSLLGLNALSQFESITIKNNQMIIE
ncbi:MAG: TIGR02281 family clan AA aspartic protease [Parasphingorhabdus sp.]|uniref:retropepsin-like aspartic protease family protein n=1 Tax=Parasphingorhabdus sp. TaxID=2709688 RepID=UPI0032985FFC